MKIANRIKKLAILSLAAVLGAAVLGPQLHTYAAPMEPISVRFNPTTSMLTWGVQPGRYVRYTCITATREITSIARNIRAVVLDGIEHMSPDDVRRTVPTNNTCCGVIPDGEVVAIIIGWIAPFDEDRAAASLGTVDELTVWAFTVTSSIGGEAPGRGIKAMSLPATSQDFVGTGPKLTPGRYYFTDQDEILDVPVSGVPAFMAREAEARKMFPYSEHHAIWRTRPWSALCDMANRTIYLKPENPWEEGKLFALLNLPANLTVATVMESELSDYMEKPIVWTRVEDQGRVGKLWPMAFSVPTSDPDNDTFWLVTSEIDPATGKAKVRPLCTVSGRLKHEPRTAEFPQPRTVPPPAQHPRPLSAFSHGEQETMSKKRWEYEEKLRAMRPARVQEIKFD